MLSNLLNQLEYCEFTKTFAPKIKNLNIKSFNELNGVIDQDYIDFLVYEYIKRNKNTFLINVWPVTQNGDDIIKKYYTKHSKIIYQKNIKLHPDSYYNFLRHISDKKSHPLGTELWFAKPYSDNTPLKIYLIQTDPNTLILPISQIKNYLVKVFNNNQNHINNIEKKGLNHLKNLYITTKNKRDCRKALSDSGKVPKVLKETPPYNYSHHINDLHEETVEVGKLVFNNNSLKILRYMQWNKLQGFDKKFKNFKNFLKAKNIDTDRILIYNSGILGPLGLREPSDIDFFHLNNKLIQQRELPPDIDIQNKYFKRGYMILQNSHRAQYMEDNPNFMSNVPINSSEIKWKLSLNELVFNPKNYYYYQGIKFMWIDVFKKVKMIRGRPKDREQVNMVTKFIKL